MFLYNQKYVSEAVPKQVTTEDVDFYTQISIEQSLFISNMHSAALEMYQDLYNAKGNQKIITEATNDFFDRILKFLKDFKDKAVKFIRECVNRFKNLIGKRGKRINDLKELEKEYGSILMGFEYKKENLHQLFTYNNYFRDLNTGIHGMLASDPEAFMTSNAFNTDRKEIRVLKYYDDGLHELKDRWNDTEFYKLTINILLERAQQLEDLPKRIDKFDSEVKSILDKMTAYVNKVKASGKLTDRFNSKVTMYTNTLMNIVKEFLAMVPKITKNFDSTSFHFIKLANDWLADKGYVEYGVGKDDV